MRDDIMEHLQKRDFREETKLNSHEFRSLQHLSGKYGISKAAVLRYALLQLADDDLRKERMSATGE